MFKLWAKTKANIVVIIFGCLLLLGAVALAEELESAPAHKVHITASESGSYDLENQVFTGSGDVKITYGDLVLQGAELQIDLISGDLILQGAVTVVQDQQAIHGEYFTYNLETGLGKLSTARAEIALPEETGHIYLQGESVKLTEQGYLASGSTFTTCDLATSHYHLKTKEIELFPDEKVIVRGVTYYEGKIPLFYWPYLVIPLKESDRDSIFTLPELGYGEREGYYMKNAFNYYFSATQRGQLYLDLYTNLGIGLGAKHDYLFDKLGQGSIYLYGIPSQIGTENSLSKGAFNHKFSTEKLVFKTTNTLEESWVRHEVATDNRLTLTLPKLTVEGWYIYRDTPSKQVVKYQEYGGRWSQSFGDALSLNVRGSLTKQENPDPVRLLDYLAESRYTQGKHTLTLAVQQQYNPDLLEAAVQPWKSVQRIPEFKWEVRNPSGQALPLNYQVVLGRYEENPSRTRNSRAYGQVALRAKSSALTPTSSLTYQGDLNTAFYGGGENKAQSWVYGRLTFNQKFGQQIQFSTTYSQREVWGATPFLFDRQKPLQNQTARLSYTASKLQLSLNGSYDYKTTTFGYLVLQTRLQPQEGWLFDFYANYDLNTQQVHRIVPMAQYKAGVVELKLGGRYLVQEQVWDLLDTRLTIPLGETWTISYDALYEPLKSSFKQGTIALTKDLHCRTLSASYDHVDKRIALQYTIKAFPTLPIGWDSESGLGLFDFNEVSDIIGGMD